jgi:hypothetical protein
VCNLDNLSVSILDLWLLGCEITKCGSVVGMSVELMSQTIEVHCEVCDLRLLGLSVAMEGRVAEIDVASGKSGSRVDLRVGVWSGSLIGGGHLVMKSDEVIGVEAWNWKADISSC